MATNDPECVIIEKVGEDEEEVREEARVVRRWWATLRLKGTSAAMLTLLGALLQVICFTYVLTTRCLESDWGGVVNVMFVVGDIVHILCCLIGVWGVLLGRSRHEGRLRFYWRCELHSSTHCGFYIPFHLSTLPFVWTAICSFHLRSDRVDPIFRSAWFCGMAWEGGLCRSGTFLPDVLLDIRDYLKACESAISGLERLGAEELWCYHQR